MNDSPAVLRVGDRLRLRIEKTVPGGAGLARHEGRVVFVRLGLPGSVVDADVVKKKKSFAEARFVATVEAAPNEVAPRCPHFFTCGGCSFQHLPYADQLVMKEGFVREALEGIGKLAVPLLPIHPSPDVWHYRNKVEFSFGYDREGVAGIGYKLPGSFYRIFRARTCPIFDPRADALLEAVQAWIPESGVPVYDGERHGGVLQYLLVRRSVATGELLVNLTLRANAPQDALARAGASFLALMQGLPDPPAHILVTVNTTGVSAHGAVPQVLHGEGVLRETLGGLSFEVSPFSFFQTNTRAAEVLYREVLEAAALTGTEKVLDLYCGTGTIGQLLTSKAREVIGLELNPSSVADANRNAQANGLTAYRAVAGDVQKLLAADPALAAGTDTVVVDPPRAGLEPKALEHVRAINAQRIVYVSCNPATLARDLALLADTYETLHVRPVDMFPHTPHVEAVATLVRR